MKPQVFMFKVITMSDEIVKEECTFNFDFLGGSDVEVDSNGEALQRLILSQDLTKLMEVFSDSRCRIYEKKQQHRKKRITWVMKY
jgi:hypothetical protein